MRLYSERWDLPDGVKNPEDIAADVMAEERIRRQCQRLMSTRPSKPILRLMSDEEAAFRRDLLARAFTGDQVAIDELWRQYGVRYSRAEVVS